MRKYTKIITIGLILLVTFFIFSLWLRQDKENVIDPKVISTNPLNNSTELHLPVEVQITFNIPINDEIIKNLVIQTTPVFENNITYKGNQLTIKPVKPFNLNTEYKILLKYQEREIYTLNFKTYPLSLDEFNEQTDLQTQGDLNFTEAYKNFLIDHPWYQKLPIETDKYRIVYDLEVKKFRIRILKENASQNEKTIITNEAVENIKKIGVKEPIEFYLLEN